MAHRYSANEFYMLLKLGIWQSGPVHFWGQADVIPPWKSMFHFGELSVRYDACSPVKKHLDTGLYLLDLCYTGKDPAREIYLYQLVVAVCRNDMTHLEALYTIQAGNYIPPGEFFFALAGDEIVPDHFRERGRYAFFSGGSARRSLTGNIPIGSRFIHHR